MIFRVEGTIMCLFFLPRFSDVSFSLKKKILTCGVDLQGGGQVFMLVLFAPDL